MFVYREAFIDEARAIARTEVESKRASLVGVIEFMAPNCRPQLAREVLLSAVRESDFPKQERDL